MAIDHYLERSGAYITPEAEQLVMAEAGEARQRSDFGRAYLLLLNRMGYAPDDRGALVQTGNMRFSQTALLESAFSLVRECIAAEYEKAESRHYLMALSSSVNRLAIALLPGTASKQSDLEIIIYNSCSKTTKA